MKKIATLAAVVSLFVSGTLYPQTAIVTHIDTLSDTVTVTNASGFSYTFSGAEDLMTGDVMSLVMYNNATPKTIRDDEIIFARYSGFTAEDFGEEEK